jgi:hypothetical protein
MMDPVPVAVIYRSSTAQYSFSLLVLLHWVAESDDRLDGEDAKGPSHGAHNCLGAHLSLT